MLITMTKMIKQKKLDLRDALVWYGISLVILILDAFPQILSALSLMLGIRLPSNMVFMLAILLLIVMAFALTTSISRVSSNVRTLTQEVALLKKELEELKKQND